MIDPKKITIALTVVCQKNRVAEAKIPSPARKNWSTTATTRT